jgi:hypothetical protein
MARGPPQSSLGRDVIYYSYRHADIDGHRQCRISVFGTPTVPESHAREIGER